MILADLESNINQIKDYHLTTDEEDVKFAINDTIDIQQLFIQKDEDESWNVRACLSEVWSKFYSVYLVCGTESLLQHGC